MTVRLRDVVAFLDATLEIDRYRDHAVNGLQVEGRQEVDNIVTGVSATLELFERAADLGADLIVVHHGLIWGDGLRRIDGAAARRLEFLLSRGISLAAYHLPLDKHPRLGNNVGLCDALGLLSPRGSFGDVRGVALGASGSWAAPLSRDEAIARITGGVLRGAEPTFVIAHGPETVRRVGVCSGAASDLLEAAVRDGCDLFLTGELAERSAAMARELQVTLVGAGHYATEVFGPQRLVDELRMRFPEIQARFVGVPSPL